jgi:cytochrome c oxidase assembly factor CtaG
MQGVADWAIHFALYTLPMLLILLGIPTVIGFYVYRQWRKRRPPAASTPVPTEG